MADAFSLDGERLDLPRGAWAGAERRMLRWQGREVFGLSQGPWRAYLHPVFTPQGFAVTAESPADHPHHNAVWIASDHVTAHVPATAGTEAYTYNFYVNQTFQGRAPGRILETACEGAALGDGYRIEQTLDWRGPPEWGAPDGRVVARERRRFDVAGGEAHHLIDVVSTLEAAEWPLTLGPTRHAYFNVRIAMCGALRGANGADAAAAISGSDAPWVDASGPVGGGHVAGIAVMTHPANGQPWWFVTDWGVVTVNHFRVTPLAIAPGESASFAFRLVVHDGAADSLDLARLYAEFADRAKL